MLFCFFEGVGFGGEWRKGGEVQGMVDGGVYSGSKARMQPRYQVACRRGRPASSRQRSVCVSVGVGD